MLVVYVNKQINTHDYSLFIRKKNDMSTLFHISLKVYEIVMTGKSYGKNNDVCLHTFLFCFCIYTTVKN